MRISVGTDTGKVRKVNQDSFFAEEPAEDKRGTHGCLFVVADGMGGHAAGEVASALAIDIVSNTYYDSELDSETEPGDSLRRAFREANSAILKEGSSNLDRYGMGTTCTGIVLRDDQYWICHVGDSRIYRMRGGKLEILTADHTLIQQMIEKGEINEGEAERLSIRHILVRAMGIDEKVKLDLSDTPIPLLAGDTLLICSDGLHSVIPDSEIAETLGRLQGDEAVKTLVNKANEAGGPDNITIVLVERL